MEAEAHLLTEHGHDVMKYERTNAEIYEDGTFADKIRALRDVAWSEKSYREIKNVIQNFRPDIMHVHNYWLILTPSILAAAKDCNVATVLTLHNYRLICPGNQMLCNGSICEACIHGSPWRVLLHRCFPGKSFLKSYLSLVLYSATKKNLFLNDWVDAYIALSAFGRSKFIEAGLLHDKIFVKPNFMTAPLEITPKVSINFKGALFAGRLSQEKGITTLLKAWAGLNYPLQIAGDGPLFDRMKNEAPASVEFLGWCSHEEIIKRLSEAAFFVFPSEWYEGFPLSLLEAMALGKAIIASDLGPRSEMIADGLSGLLFKAGNVADLRQKIDRVIADQYLRQSLGNAARKKYLELYTPEKNYEMLISIYKKALASARSHK